MAPVRILLLADTHLGFDEPRRPRVRRRRRGPDFWANYHRALEPARQGQVDLVVHGGDLLYRSKVPAELTARALQPLKDLADKGIPVALVPGNHERSAIPHPLLALHPGLLVFDRPRTFHLDLAGKRVSVAGFPCERSARAHFRARLSATGWDREPADLRLLCLHQAVEGAKVGPVNFTFTTGADVVRAADLPQGLAAVLSGHIHRHQVLTRDLAGRPLPCPVFYPGAIERTAFAEKDEAKGFVHLELDATEEAGGRVRSWRFEPLPARPMIEHDLDVDGLNDGQLERRLGSLLASVPADAIVRLRLRGRPLPGAENVLTAARLRALAGESRSVEVRSPA